MVEIIFGSSLVTISLVALSRYLREKFMKNKNEEQEKIGNYVILDKSISEDGSYRKFVVKNEDNKGEKLEIYSYKFMKEVEYATEGVNILSYHGPYQIYTLLRYLGNDNKCLDLYENKQSELSFKTCVGKKGTKVYNKGDYIIDMKNGIFYSVKLE